MAPKIDNYYNHFDEGKNYVEMLYRDGYGAQGAEQNEQQAILNAKIRKLGRSIYKDGDIIKGAQLVLDPVSGHVSATAGDIFLDGFIWTVAAAEFDIPVTGTVAVGVHLKESIISELEDPSLRNPARGQRSEGEPGAWRRKVEAFWGFGSDGVGDTSFYPVYTIDDGVQRAKEAPPSLDSVNQALARYDRDSTGTGTYAVNGLTVVAGDDLEDGRQVYHLSEGRARVGGMGVELATSRRVIYPAMPDLRTIGMEIVDAEDAALSETGQRVEVAHAPFRDLISLRITVEETFEMVHGGYSGCSDALPVTGVISIQEIRQLETVYEPGTDYIKKGDMIDWGALGNEPAPGSTFSAKIRYLKDAEHVARDLDGFVVRDAVPGTQILFSYEQMLPRYDRMAMDNEGQVTWFKGVASEFNPQKPDVPDSLLALCTVYQNWRPGRQLVNDAARVVPFDSIAAMNSRMDRIEQEVARNRLEMDAATRESGARKGYFVDPLLDDSMRDQGISQSAAIVDECLTLPISEAASYIFPGDVKRLAMRPFRVESLLEQPYQTGEMQVNPYMAFDPFPAQVSLKPSIDQWTESQTIWTSAITRQVRLGRTSYTWGWRTTSTANSVETVSSSSSDIEYLRQIPIEFTVAGFGAGERLKSATFDGIDIMADIGAKTADANGRITGSFTIPPKVPAGSKSVVFTGEGGTRGTGVFVGQGNITVQTMRNVTIQYGDFYEPIAQTFALDRSAWMAGVDLWFTAKDTQIRVQLRNVENGMPGRQVLAEAWVEPENVSLNGPTRFLFDIPISLEAGAEYAFVVMCNDAVAKAAVAQLGKFDPHRQEWVSSQPYTVGVMLSSSNASTWTPHQDFDLKFRILEAIFDDREDMVINLGKVEVDGATDLLVYAVADIPSAACRAELELELPDGTVQTVAPGQPVSLAAPATGQIGVKAWLYGDAKASAALYPGTQLLAGKAGLSADYYTRSIAANEATKASLIYDALIPSGAYVTPQIRIDNGDWQSMQSAGTTQGDDGMVEFRFTCPLEKAIQIKARLLLSGTLRARPLVKNIRMLAVA